MVSARAVTRIEPIGGMRSAQRREVERLLATLRVKPVTIPIARRAGTLVRPVTVSSEPGSETQRRSGGGRESNPPGDRRPPHRF